MRMRHFKHLLRVLLMLWSVKLSAQTPLRPFSFPEWEKACGGLAPNRQIQSSWPAIQTLPLRSFQDFERVLTPFMEWGRTGSLARAERWLDGTPGPDFYNPDRAHFARPPSAYEPFVQRMTIPAGSEVLFHADLHGDIRSLMGGLTWLNSRGDMRGFEIARTNLYLVFLGDYADRGKYGIEVLYTLLALKLSNPDRVHLIRGNHEEYTIAARYGLLAECAHKFSGAFDPKRLCRFFDFLPAVLYLGNGTNYIQCNHGGMEPGFNPGRLLDAPEGVHYQRIVELDRARWLDANAGLCRSLIPPSILSSKAEEFGRATLTSPRTPISLGFMWNDFTIAPGEGPFAIDEGRGMVFGDVMTREVLRQGSTATHRLRAVIRGHQQAGMLTPMMSRILASRGVFRHWQSRDSKDILGAKISELAQRLEQDSEQTIPEGSVYTLNVSPDSIYGILCGYDFDTWASIKVNAEFSQWRVRRINLVQTGGEIRESSP